MDPASQKDEDKAPAAFVTQAELNTAVQKQVSLAIKSNSNNANNGGRKRACFICGSEDHLKPDCPQNPKNQNSGNQQSDNGDKKKSWKKAYAGDTITRNGRTWYWCSICKWCNSHHKTSEHHVGVGKNSSNSQNQTSTSADMACIEIDADLTFEWMG